jgi:hypothetical protein
MSEERPDGRIDTLIVNDAAARRQRLAEHFAAISVLDRTLEELYRANADRFEVTSPAVNRPRV